MREIILCCLLTALTLFIGGSLSAQVDDIKEVPMCKLCGMSRDTFSRSRMLIEYSDGTRVGLCSLRCSVLELATNPGKRLKAIRVGDYNTRSLIDCRKSEWVVGGKIEGVMSSRAKWAFADRAAAEAFTMQNEGILGSFDDAMKAAYIDLYTDTKMIQDGLGAEERDAEAEEVNTSH